VLPRNSFAILIYREIYSINIVIFTYQVIAVVMVMSVIVDIRYEQVKGYSRKHTIG
jgi:hypothetical protein